METGIYKITNLIDGKIYIGSTVKSFKIRMMQHLYKLRTHKHFNIHLQRAFDKDGESNFEFSILEECDRDVIVEREDFWIQSTECYKQEIGYNFCPHARTSLNRKVSDETKEKIRRSLIGYKHTEEFRLHNIQVQKTRHRSQKEKAKWRNTVKKYRGKLHPMYNKGRKIIQLDLHFNIVNIYENASRAAEAVGFSAWGLIEVCNDRRKSRKLQCYFLYYDEYLQNNTDKRMF